MARSGFPSLTWVGADGDTPLTTLEAPTYSMWLVGEIDGLGTPEVVTWDRSLALSDGGVWTGSRFSARHVFMPVAIDAETFAGRADAVRRLSAAFLKGGRPVEGVLRLNYGNGDERELRRVRFTGGLRDPMPGPGFYVTGVELTAYDPLFYGRQRSKTWRTGVYDFFPGPPFSLSDSGISDTLTVGIPGEVAVWPKWRLEGPMDSFSATLGADSWAWPLPIADGEWIEVDTDPRAPLANRVVDHTGANRWADFVVGGYPTLFSLGAGVNEVSVSSPGVGDNTAVALSWTPAYLTA